jgi:hypothetical protein
VKPENKKKYLERTALTATMRRSALQKEIA